MYRELIQAHTPHARFGEPATESDLSALEAELGFALPLPVRQLLRETNGVHLVMSDWRSPEETEDPSFQWFLPMQEVLENTLALRQPDNPDEALVPSALIAFASLPNGDYVGFADTGEDTGLFAWAHDAVASKRLARNLEEFILWTLSE